VAYERSKSRSGSDHTGEEGGRTRDGIKIQVKQEDASSKSKGAISFSVFNPEGIKVVSQLKAMANQGEYLGSFLPEKGGIYKVRVETLEGHLEESVVVAEGMEGLDAVPNPDHLKRIAEYGREFLSSNDF
jgi:hypothetical protein